MSAERYWTLERPDGTPNELISDDRVKHYRTADAYRQGYRVKGPFVRESDHQGAVTALQEARDALQGNPNLRGGGTGGAMKALAIINRALEGQS
jgi:hypothetical protein